MQMKYRILRCCALLGVLFATNASAQWELDNSASSLNFISIKNGGIAETHAFTSLMGYVGVDGSVQISVDLDSVSTGIEVRDQRMRETLFDTADFATANIKAQVDAAIIESLQPGTVISTELKLALSLHGAEAQITAPVMAISESSGLLRVVSVRPVIVSAGSFGLAEGVRALQSIAGLQSIATAVPVSFNLTFKPAPSER